MLNNEMQPLIENKLNEMSDTALIDRLSLSRIAVEEISNPDDLDKRGILRNGKSEMKYYTKSGKAFTSLSVKNDFFGKLKAGVNYGKGGLYSSFTTSVKNGFCSNLICNTACDYRKQIEESRKYLAENYGIYANFENALVKQIEINKTFRIGSRIAEYKRPVELIAWNIPGKKRMNIVHDFKEKTEMGFDTETFVITSKSAKKIKDGKTVKSRQHEELVFYGKTEQLEKMIVLSGEYMRVEIRITGTAKIKKMFGTNKFYEITDQCINDFFNSEIKEMITDPYDTWKKQRDKELLKILKSQRKEKHDWVVNTLLVLANKEIKSGVPVILDVSEILPLIDRMGIKDPRRRYKIRENFKKQAEKRANVFCSGDDRKLCEIIHKLQKKTVPPQNGYDAPDICPAGDIEKNA